MARLLNDYVSQIATRKDKPPSATLFSSKDGHSASKAEISSTTLKLLVPNSKRLGGYIQMGVLFSSKRYTPREDLLKRYTVLLKKALERHLFLLDKT